MAERKGSMIAKSVSKHAVRAKEKMGDMLPDSLKKMLHIKSRCEIYPNSEIRRIPVEDSKVDWNVMLADYKPVKYTSERVLRAPWADPELGSKFVPKWNSLDGKVDRRSHEGQYDIDDEGFPLNPFGRTGLCGRGNLGRWGPNHAADPVVSTWVKTSTGDLVKHKTSDLPLLRFLAIRRRDNGEWAIPGGMVDPGERVTATLRREFFEEALDSLGKSPQEKEALEAKFGGFFAGGNEVYRGYVDDPRNTDNAWMETVAYNFHDETGEVVSALPLKAGDDAVGIRWTEISSDLNLYASHKDIILRIAQRLGAHW